MSAIIVPFPIEKRRSFILTQAHRACSLKPESADHMIAGAKRQQADVMRRKGIAEDLIERELRAMETEIRARIWKLILTGDPAA